MVAAEAAEAELLIPAHDSLVDHGDWIAYRFAG